LPVADCSTDNIHSYRWQFISIHHTYVIEQKRSVHKNMSFYTLRFATTPTTLLEAPTDLLIYY